jgi:hypothetical protein
VNCAAERTPYFVFAVVLLFLPFFRADPRRSAVAKNPVKLSKQELARNATRKPNKNKALSQENNLPQVAY